MGVSEVLLCPYRCLEYKMVRLEKLKIQLCFYSRLSLRWPGSLELAAR